MDRSAEPNRIIEQQYAAADRIFFEQASSHTVPVFFWKVSAPHQVEAPTICGGSGVLILLKGVTYVLTCSHVIRAFYDKRQSDPTYRFQVGGQAIDLDERLHDEDSTLDLATINVSGLDLVQLGARDIYDLQPLVPTRWPPDPVAISGGRVIICGFPGGETREIDIASRITTAPGFKFVERVSDVGLDSFLIPFARDTWTDDFGEPAPDAIRKLDIGGMSGAPVFTTRRIAGGLEALELLGITLSQIAFGGDGVFVRSVNRISEDGRIIRHSLG